MVRAPRRVRASTDAWATDACSAVGRRRRARPLPRRARPTLGPLAIASLADALHARVEVVVGRAATRLLAALAAELLGAPRTVEIGRVGLLLHREQAEQRRRDRDAAEADEALVDAV